MCLSMHFVMGMDGFGQPELSTTDTVDLKERSHVIRFRCASEANRIECASDAHRSRSHGTTGKQIQSELWRAWVS